MVTCSQLHSCVQVATAVAGILKDSGYFMVTESSQRFVKMFELLELDENQEVVSADRFFFLYIARKDSRWCVPYGHGAYGCESSIKHQWVAVADCSLFICIFGKLK